MRRRLIRLLGVMVLLPAAARAAESLADHLEATKGRSVSTRLLRRASGLADRRARRGPGWR